MADIPKKKPKNYTKMLDMLNTEAAVNSLSPKTFVDMVGIFSRKAYENGELEIDEYLDIVKPLFGETGEKVTNKIKEYEDELEKYATGGRVNFLDGGDTEYNAMVTAKYIELGGKDGTGMDIDSFAKEYFPKFADGGRIGFKGGADAATESFSKSVGSTRPGRKDPVGGFNLSDGQGPTFGGAPPTTGGGSGGNNNNPPPFSTNNTTLDTTFFDNTFKSGLMSNISPSILARLARIKKGFKPILGKDGKLGVEYLNEDELYDTLTNFRITQDLEDLMKTKKLDPELKYKKEIGDNTFIEGGINQAGDANIMFKKQFALFFLLIYFSNY